MQATRPRALVSGLLCLGGGWLGPTLALAEETPSRAALAPSPDQLDKTKSNASALFLACDVFSAGAVVIGGLSLWITVAPPGGSTAPSSEKPVPLPSARPLQVGFQENQLKFRGRL